MLLGQEIILGDPTRPHESWLSALDSCEAIINLAGEPLFAHRWSAKFKQQLWDSRVNSTRWIATRLLQKPMANRVFLSGSAIGYYGDRGEEELTERSAVGSGFLAELSREWEAAAEPAREVARLVHLRTGIVLDPSGGSLKQMLPAFKLFAGGPLGNGQQWMSWIHIDDMVEGIVAALVNSEIQGSVNFTAPEPIRNWGFSKTLGEVVHRPCWLPAPKLAIRLLLGEVAQVALASQRVYPNRLLDSGFEFRFPTLKPALSDLLAPRSA